jgi:serine phosphatase RsbU (regulator of sigma subunit)/anti-sigma regulatory factor (Ser/Thr protein kinase)
MSVDNYKTLPWRARYQRIFPVLSGLPSWIKYIASAIVVAISTVLLLLLQSFVAVSDGLKRGPAFIAFYFIAIAISTLIGGLRAGLFSVLLSLFCTICFLIPPAEFMIQPTMSNEVTLLIVVVVGSLVAFGMEAYRSNMRLLVQNLDLLAVEQARANQEAVLNRIGQSVRNAKHPEQIQRVVISAVGELLDADCCCFIMYDSAHGTPAETQCWRKDGVDQPLSQLGFAEAVHKLVSQKNNGKTIVVEDVQTDTTLGRSEETREQQRFRSAIIVPLGAADQWESFVAVSMDTEPRIWTHSHVSLVEAVAVQTRVSIDAARLQQKEHNIAIQLQAALQPELTLNVDGLSIASFYRAALDEANVGGDFFDAFALANGSIVFAVGDVSGKGLAAASQVAAIRHMLRCLLQTMPSIVSAVEQLNSVLIAQELLPAFATLFVAVLNPATLEMEYVSCGHEPGLIYRPGDENPIIQLPATGPVIGVFDDAFVNSNDGLFDSVRKRLYPGDAFLVYTDGVCDAGVDVNSLLGVDGIVKVMRNFYSESADNGSPNEPSAADLLDYCVNMTEQFAMGYLRDDICLLAISISRDYQTSENIETNERNDVDHQFAGYAPSSTKTGYAESLRKKLLADVLKIATHGKLRIVTDPQDLPPSLSHQSTQVLLDIGENVRRLRRTVRDAAEEAGLAGEFSDALEMASGEAANNSLVHAVNGVGYVSWDDGGNVQVRIEDAGTGIPYEDIPRATLERGYTTAGTLGQGFWIILQSVKRCWISTGKKGTVVVLEQDNETSANEALPVSVLI